MNSYAVWATVVFVLNVLAFLLMGLQARDILQQLQSDALMHALSFAGIVLGIVIGVRFAYVMAYGFVLRTFRHFFEPNAAFNSTDRPRSAFWCRGAGCGAS